MKADELTELAIKWLRARFPGAHIIPELSLAEYGGAQIDVAAICDDQIVGVEVKGEGDSPSRLKLQGQMYPRVCRKVYLLPAPSLLASCEKHCPPEWALIYPPGTQLSQYGSRVQCPDTGIGYRAKYASGKEPSFELERGTGYGLTPAALAAMIWTTEYSRLAQAIDPSFGVPRLKADCIRHVAATYPLPKIERAVCEVLRQRNWLGGKSVHYPESEAA